MTVPNNDALSTQTRNASNRPQTLSGMIAAGRYNGIIDGEYLPTEVDQQQFTTEGAKLLTFGADELSTPKVLAAMAKQGYKPASIETLLAYRAEDNLPKCERYLIIALATAVPDDRDFNPEDGYVRVPCLAGGIDQIPSLCMVLDTGHERSEDWADEWVADGTFVYFLGVRLT